MTFAKSRVSHTFGRTALLLKRQLWIWPIIAIVILTIAGYGVRTTIEKTMKQNLQSQLQTLLDVEIAMVQNWQKGQASNAEAMANDKLVRELVYKILDLTQEDQVTDAEDATARQNELPHVMHELKKLLSPGMTAHDYTDYALINQTHKILTSSNPELVRKQGLHIFDEFLQPVMEGETVITPPFASLTPAMDEFGEARTGLPTMFVCAPVRDDSFQVVGALAFRMRPEQEFTRILQLGRLGESGETYAFNKAGVMVSNSRFDESLILMGIIPDTERSRSILNVQLRDPGQDLSTSGRLKVRRSEMPLTKLAAEATNGRDGIDVDGYRDYRGVQVTGAWKWLPEMHMGIATEIDLDEAYRPLIILQRIFWLLYALLALAAVAIFIFTLIVARVRREAQKAAVEAKELGQYRLEEKVGSGAMGVVYRGYHAMLRRPTAIKLLNVEKVNDASIKRFEHEVQITCQLNHPNTIAIYDYGKTPEGVFYYAMEFLDGIDLELLVNKFGPLPEGRVIHILSQICGSLYEAHSQGLVHRDIKPSNIMLNRRGGEADVVKVLDFGLVKALDQEKQSGMTAAGTLTGTPLYMSPEAIQSPSLVDSCSDLYAVGAVGYFLLTGKPVFEGESVVDLLSQHVNDKPIPPSLVIGKTVSEELEHALLGCLEKNRANRPQTARILAQLLNKTPTASAWSQEAAEAWWGRYERGQLAPNTGNSPSDSTATEQVHLQTMISNNEADEE